MSVCAPTRVTELKDGMIRTADVDPADFFSETAAAGALAGGSVQDNARITRGVLSGNKGPMRNVVLLNAAAALMAAGKAEDYREGILLAGKSIDSGAAEDKLDQLIRFTQENG
jgi:anthranilate phosphoribosyltransferase